MKRTFALLSLTSCLLTLGGCQHAGPEAYRNPGDPEKLLMASSDLATIDLTDKDYARRLGDALKHNPPTRAVLNCAPTEKSCKKSGQMLAKGKVATESTGSGNTVTLVYEHVAARDCENRYIDNSRNQMNLNYSSFGCSVTGNTVQMVTDKRQFTNPNLLDFFDGEKAATVYDNYANPAAAGPSSGNAGSTANNSLIPTGSGGQ